MEYFVADSYKNADRIGTPYKNNKGNLVTKIKYKCPRCGGLGIIAAGVENGHIVPIPVANGICYQCGGAKYFTKEVRLYTKKEYAAIQTSKERAKTKKEQERKEKMEREYETNCAKWLEENGFDAEGHTYMFYGDSYSIKDELKAAGFKFNYLLKWHKADPAGYEDKVIEFRLDELYTMSAWGKGTQNSDAEKIVEKRIAEVTGAANREWYGETGEKIDKVLMTLIYKGEFESRYGFTNILKFEDAEGHLFTWFTATNRKEEIGTKLYVSGTIKEHAEYKGEKSTTLTRCKLKGVD